MHSGELPKILLIDTGYLSSNNATGITLRSIWKDWPDEKLMSINVNPNQRVENDRYLDRIHIINRKYIIGAQVTWYIKRMLWGLQHDAVVNSNSLSNKKTIKGSLVELTKGAIDSLPIFLDKETKRKIKEFNPDVIYTLGGSVRVLKYASLISRLIDKKILIHFMDGYLDVQYKVYRITYPFNKILLKSLKKCMKRSSAILCISEKMANEYNELFNLPTYISMNCDCDVNEQEYRNTEPLQLIYAGGLHLGRWDNIEELCRTINKINSKAMRVCFDLYIPENEVKSKRKLVSEYKGVNVYPAKTHKDILEIYKTADLLVFVESFEQHIRKYTRLSFSTKLPEYMAAKKPIICFAPDELATSQYISKHKIGICINERNELHRQLQEVLFNYDIRKKLAVNGFERYQSDFSPDQVKKNIMLALEANMNR